MDNPLAAAIAPQQQAPQQQAQQSPPRSPEELEQRKGAWGQYFEKLKQDPDVRNALMQFGTQMLAGEQRGQSTASLLANSVQNSMRGLQMSRQRQAELATSGRDKQLEQDKLIADTAGVEASTAKTAAQTGEVAASASSARNLESSLSSKHAASAASTSAQIPGKVGKLDAETSKLTSEVGVAGQNADANTLNAETNKLEVQLTNMINQAKLVQGDKELGLRAEQIKKVYEAAMTGGGGAGSPEMQMLTKQLIANGVDPANVSALQMQQALFDLRSADADQAILGSDVFDATAKDAETGELLATQAKSGILGGRPKAPAKPLATTVKAVKARYGETAEVRPASVAGKYAFEVWVDGELETRVNE